jgi:thiamine-phosphate pyrophosphorylase
VQDTSDITRLVVVLEAGDGARERLTAAIQCAPIACVMIHAGPPSHGRDATLAELIRLARSGGAIALIVDDPELARSIAADGVHVSNVDEEAENYAAARTALGPKATIGVDAGPMRHTAMTAGEAGADYIAFGARAASGNASDGNAARLEQIAWWSEIFEVPCVALDVGSADDARNLGLAGADFVAVTLAAGQSPAAVAEQVRAFAIALDEAAQMRGGDAH